MDASEIHAWRLNLKEVSTPQYGEKYIPDCRWNSQILRRRSGSENIHLNRDRPDGGEEQGDFQGESDGSSSRLIMV